MAAKFVTEENNNILGVGIPTDDLSESEKEERNATIRAFEGDILDGLLAAAAFRTETYPIEIKRNGAVVLSFRVRPLSEDEYSRCLKTHTKFKKMRGGVKVAESTDQSAYRADLIFLATVDEDRAMWQNAEAFRKLNVATPWQLIDKVLMAGEKSAILDKLDEISGYDHDDDLADETEEAAKN